MTHDEPRWAFSLPSNAEMSRLLRRARSHDTLAFEHIYDRFADTIYIYALYQHLSASTAALIVAATFEAMVAEMERFDTSEQNSATHTRIQLLRIAVIQAARYNGTAVDERNVADDAELPLRIQGDPRLLAALRRLTHEQREVVVLRIVLRLSAGDIAEITGKSESQVRQAQAHGLGAIAGVLYAGSPRLDEAA